MESYTENMNTNTGKPEAFFVVSAWNNDVGWIEEYTNNYLIYDKSFSFEPDKHVLQVQNVGYNIYDIMHFIINNYDNLPDIVAFLEGNPFDHCKKETFDRLIYKTDFTPVEDYSHVPESYAHKKDIDGGYMEINNSWYFASHVTSHGAEVNRYFHNYNDFLDMVFENPEHPDWIRFSPGGQYIVPKKNILFYSINFYKRLMGFVNYHRIPSEGHAIERCLYYIFTNKWDEKHDNQ